MSWLDLVIVVFVLLAIIRGSVSGLARQAFSLGGFLAGLYLGALVAPVMANRVSDPLGKTAVVIVIVLAAGSLVSALGEWIGHHAAVAALRYRVEPVDAVLGAVFGGVLILLTVWLVAGMTVGSPNLSLNRAVSDSRIIRWLDRTLPPSPPVISRLTRLVDPNGFPQVFAGLEPAPAGPITPATDAQVQQAIKADEASTVKVQGLGCGGLVSGSGFVVAPGVVMTNAHVVAGIRQPTVIDANGRHPVTVALFDPNLDLAILRVSDLAGPILNLDSAIVPRATQVVVLGYPGGGGFTAGSAGVLDERFATGRNIYNQGLTGRDIYEVQAIVQPGNSGGPLVLPDGTVVGVVFARSQTNTQLGYALTSPEVLSKLHQAEATSGSVGTGACAAG